MRDIGIRMIGTLGVVVLLAAAAGGEAAVAEGVSGPAEEAAGGKTGDAERPSDAPFVHEGTVHGPAHGFQFGVPAGWTLDRSSTADEMVLSSASCGECALKVLISSGNSIAVEDTVRGIKQKIFKDADAVIIDEEVIRVAREKGYTLIREDLQREAVEKTAPASPSPEGQAPAPDADGKRTRTRYVTFNHGGDKYYLVLRAPRDRFAAEDRLFEELLESLRFKP